MRREMLAAVCAVQLCLGAGACFAEPVADSPRYWSGGVGEDELEHIRLIRNDYNLRVLFALKDGTYVSDVRVEIVDERQTPVLTVDSAGPFLLVDLPRKLYRFKATYEQLSAEQRIDLRSAPAKEAVFRW